MASNGSNGTLVGHGDRGDRDGGGTGRGEQLGRHHPTDDPDHLAAVDDERRADEGGPLQAAQWAADDAELFDGFHAAAALGQVGAEGQLLLGAHPVAHVPGQLGRLPVAEGGGPVLDVGGEVGIGQAFTGAR